METLEVQLRDGTVRTLEPIGFGSKSTTSGDGGSKSEGIYNLFGFVYPPLEVEDVTAILVDGVEIPV